MKEFNEKQLAEIQHSLDTLYKVLGMYVHVVPDTYRAMGKQELADAAGVSARQLREWMSAPDVQQSLSEMGITPRAKMLHPRAVAYLCETFGIIISDNKRH